MLVKDWAFKKMEQSPEHEAAVCIMQERRAKADQAQAVVELSEDLPLEGLAPISMKVTSKMKVDEVRAACRMRKLDDTGIKRLLQERLANYSHATAVASLGHGSPAVAQEPVFGVQALLHGQAASTEDAIVARDIDLNLSMLNQLKKQIAKYKSFPAAPLEESPLKWWKLKEPEIGHLAALARDLLASPGSTAALERAFSHFGHIFCTQRARLDSQLGASVLFCHENIKSGVF